MLSIRFAGGGTTRIAYNPAQRVADVLEQVRNSDGAAAPAPGRDRAYLIAAVNSAAMAPGEVPPSAPPAASSCSSSSPAQQEVAADGAEVAPADDQEEPRSSSSSSGTTGRLRGSAFVVEPPFPPRRLDDSATLEASGVGPDGHIFATFVAPIALPDPTKRTVASGSMTPTAYTSCQELSGQFMGINRDYVVKCDATCGRSGQVYGGEGNRYTRDSGVCRAALHAGVLEKDKPGFFTVRLLGNQSVFPGSRRNGVETNTYNSIYRAMTVVPYVPGDEFSLQTAPQRLS